MAKIPEYQQRQLESSVVGVPSLDTSGKRIAAGFTDLGETGMDVFGKKMIERQHAIDAVEANKQATDFEVELEKTYQAHQQNNATDPVGKTDQFKAQGEQLLAQRVKNTKGKTAQQSVTMIGQRILGNKLAQEGKWALDQQSNNALIDVTATINKRAEAAYNFGLDGDVQQALETFNRHTSDLVASKSILNAESYTKLQKAAPETLAKASINGMLASHPEKVSEFIKALPAGALDPGDAAKYKEEAKAAILNIQKTREFEYLTQTVAQKNPELFDRYLAADPTLLGDLENFPDKKTASVMREIILKQNPVTADVKAEKVMDLWQEYSNLGVTKRGETYSAKGNLESILRFQRNVMTEVKNGVITPTQAQTFIKRLSGPMAKKLSDDVRAGGSTAPAAGIVGAVADVFAQEPDAAKVGYRAISDWVDKKKYSNPASVKSDMLQEFIARMDKEQPKDRAAVSAIINAIQTERAQMDHPELAGMAEPPGAHFATSGVLSPVSPGSKAGATQNVKAPYKRMYSPSTKQYYRVYANGKKELEPNQ